MATGGGMGGFGGGQPRPPEAMAGSPGVHHTVRGTYGKPEAGTCTAYAPWRTSCPVPPGTYSTQEVGTRSLYVQYGGPGTHGSAQCSSTGSSSRMYPKWPGQSCMRMPHVSHELCLSEMPSRRSSTPLLTGIRPG
eukprot:scaffold126132_cov69-Phaeocystis_antarctica.AAC.1